jgi:hypothetical protein
VDIGLAGPEVAAFDGVVEEAVDAVAIVAVVLGGVNPTLRGNRMGPARTVLEAEGFDLVAKLAERCGGRGARQTRPNDDYTELTLVGRIDQLHLLPVTAPLRSDRTGRNL